MFGASEAKKEGSTKNNKFSFSATIGRRSRHTKTLENEVLHSVAFRANVASPEEGDSSDDK